jgi:hypothetical protein
MSDQDEEEKKEESWVELRRFNDPIEADMAKDFLEQSGVPVLVRGNSGVTGVLNRFDTILDIRLTVPEAKLAIAKEALEAMLTPARNEEPFPRGTGSLRSRGFGHEKEARHEDADENGDAPIPQKKSPFLAMGFALILPIGAGHLYAGHQAAGKTFAAFIIGMSLLAVFDDRPALWAAVFLLIAIDALSSPFAVNRFNRNAVPASKEQYAVAGLVGALVCLVVAFSGY